MALSNTTIKNARSTTKPYKLSDERGLYLLVSTTGGRLWRFDYRFGGKRKTLAFGSYPDISLKDAREKRDEARKQLANNIDPSAIKKTLSGPLNGESFESVAREWYLKNSLNWADTHANKIIRRLEADVFPWIGTRPMREITASELLTVLRRIESRGALETAHRVHQNCGQVFRYGVATGRAERDPSGDLKGALAPWKPKHYPSITDPKEVGKLLRAIDEYEGGIIVRCALQLAPLLFVRPGELRRAEWQEIDFSSCEWRIPAEKMKARQKHIVPLSNQAIGILRELHPATKYSRRVFPSVRSTDSSMSENTINAALRSLGYEKEVITAHGFRSMASTLLHEQGWSTDVIERQLAHAERNSVKAAYNRAQHLPERRKMMQSWADYLDKLKKGAEVITLRQKS
ncbi:MAG: tyrosine-type recombinase/integrase [Gammaproteobacteria bacterium]|nr:tyrosine-type recombinase/integrase [Gammaproteobacteria bacterium]